MRVALLALTAVGTGMLLVDRGAGEKVVVPLILLQMFAASTGFAVPARRGHYDLLITGGASRLRIAGTHLLMSVAPGVAAWLALACVEAGLNRGESRALESGTVAAMAIVSLVAWALTVPMPRLSGGIMWLLAIVTMVGVTDSGREIAFSLRDGAVSPAGAALYVLCPLVLIGRPVTASSIWVVVPGLALAFVGAAAALAWITRTDIRLEAAQ
jgi:hypothetical protein